MAEYTKYSEPYPTIGDLIKDKDYDYVSYRLNFKGEYEFAGCFKVEKGEIIPLDGDIYGKYEEVIASEEWSMPEEGIIHGLSVVCDCDWIENEELPQGDKGEKDVLWLHNDAKRREKAQ